MLGVRPVAGRNGEDRLAAIPVDRPGADYKRRPRPLVLPRPMRPRNPPPTSPAPWPHPPMASVMPFPTDILLAEYDAPDGRELVVAELDELTLTYTIVVRSVRGEARRVRRHVRTLRDARAWASAYGSRRGDLDKT